MIRNGEKKVFVVAGSSLTPAVTKMVPGGVCAEFTSGVNTLAQRGQQLDEAIRKSAPSKILIFGDGVAEFRNIDPGLIANLPIILLNAFTPAQVVTGLEDTIANDTKNCDAARKLLQMYRDLHRSESGSSMLQYLQRIFLIPHIVPITWGNVLQGSNLPSAPLLQEFLNYSGGNYVPGDTTIVYTRSVLVQGAQKLANRRPHITLEDMSYLPRQRSLQSVLN